MSPTGKKCVSSRMSLCGCAAATLAVVGESGCGKSVTVHSIVKLMAKNAVVKAEHVIYRSAKDGREYRLDEMKPYGPDMRRLRGAEIGMVFQDPMSSLNPVYKVGDQVAEGLIQHTGMKKPRRGRMCWICSKSWAFPIRYAA